MRYALLPLASIIPSLIAAFILWTDRLIHRALTTAGALTPATAIPLRYRHAWSRMRLRRLSGVGAVGVIDDGRYYLDVAGWERFRSRRRRRVLLVAAIILMLAAIRFLA